MPKISLKDKKILLGVSGGISAYKVVDWLRSLQKEGASVTVVMTKSATKFVTPLTFAALSGKKVFSDMFEIARAETIPHISLAREHDLFLIAPATAQTIGRLANGLADDLLSTVALAATCKIIVCPAMNCNMWQHPATQANLDTIKQYGYEIVSPETGTMACGDEGPGRLPEWQTVQDSISKLLSVQDLTGESIVITAGPTREPVDPARFISNRSSGKMGYALARTAMMRGAKVTLVSGPSSLLPPTGINFIQVTTAAEMHREVMNHFDSSSIIVKAAAVSDFSAKEYKQQKVKKQTAALTLELKQNPDILAELGQRKKTGRPPLLVGFAAESQNHIEEGQRKLQEKNVDLLVVNDITSSDSGFEVDTNQVTLLDRNGGTIELPLLTKEETAHRIWDRVVKM